MKRIYCLLLIAALSAPAALQARFHTGMVKAVKSKVAAIDKKVTEYKAKQEALRALTAAFTFSPAAPSVGQTVTFTNAVTNTSASWAWTFGDGGTSSSQNPTHAYASAGAYTVTLTAANTAGSNAVSHTGKQPRLRRGHHRRRNPGNQHRAIGSSLQPALWGRQQALYVHALRPVRSPVAFVRPAQVTGSVLTAALSGITISSAAMTLTYTAP